MVVRKDTRTILAGILILLLLAGTAAAENGDVEPQRPHVFYGNASILGEPASGTVTAVVVGGGGSIAIAPPGLYGSPGALTPKLIVQGEDIAEGAEITFFINDLIAVCREHGTMTWQASYPFTSGAVTNLDLEVVEIPLIADFSGTPTAGFAPLAVQFTDLSSGMHDTWSWSFGDGFSSTAENPVHVYGSDGIYTVSLTVRDLSSSTEDTETKSNYIKVSGLPGAPIAQFAANVTSGDAPLTVKFTDLSAGSPFEWGWNFGDGGTSFLQNPVHTYTTPGTYTVSLSIRSVSGTDSEIKTSFIRVTTPRPKANFTANETAGVAPFPVAFTDLSTGSPATWLWSFGDGSTSALRNPTHTYTTAGIFTVSLTVSNAAGSDTLTRPDFINVSSSLLPRASFTGNPTAGYAPLAVQFNDTSTGNPVSWSWAFGDGGTASVPNPLHSYAAGTYTVTLTVGNEHGNNSLTKTNYITALRVAPAGGGGGGGGGGGSGVFYTGGTANATATPTPAPSPTILPPGGLILGPDNTTSQQTTIVSPDGMASVTIGIGVRPVDAAGMPLRDVSLIQVDPGSLPGGAPCVATPYAYELAPGGASFEPSISLEFLFSPEQWEAVGGSDPVIIWYNEAVGTWEELSTGIDQEGHTLSAMIGHGGVYAVCIRASPTTIPTETAVPPTTPISVGFPWMIVIPAILLILVILGALVYFMSTRTFKGGPPPEGGS
jgi:PKD repeat protein